MDIDAINAALRSWLLAVTDLSDGKVIDAYQEDAGSPPPRPAPPFAVIYQPLAINRRGLFDEERLDADTDGVITRCALRQFPVQVQFFGPGSVARAQDAADGLERFDVRELLAAVGLGVINPGAVANQTGLLQTRYEQRAQIEPVFALSYQSTEDVGWVETVSGTATYGGGSPVPFVIE